MTKTVCVFVDKAFRVASMDASFLFLKWMMNGFLKAMYFGKLIAVSSP